MFLKSIYIYIALLFFYLLPTNSFSLLIASEKTAYPTSTYRSNKKYNKSLNKLLEEIIKKNYELTSGYQNFPADFKKIYSNSERGLKLILDNKNYLIPLHLELETKLQLAVFGSILGNHSSAESYFWEILRRAKDVYEENDTFILDTLSSLGIHYLQSGEYKKAKEAFETLLAIQEKYLGAENPITIITRNYLFKTYRINGPLQKAQEKFDENKKLLKKVKDNKYIEKYLNNSKRFNKPIKDFYYKYAIFHLNHLFKFYQVQQLFNAGLLDLFDKDYKKAEKNFVEAEKLIIKSENFDSVSTNLYRYLGLINTALRNYEKANKYYDKSILSYKNNKDQTYSHFISLLNDKALNLVEMGNYQDGKKLLYQIISDSKNKQNIESFLIPVFNNLAKIYESNGSLTKAEFYLLKAVNVFEKNSEFGFSIKIAYANLAKVYARQGNFKKSKIYLEKAFGIETDFFGEDPQKFLQTIYELNSIYLYEFQVKDFLDSSEWILDNIKNSKDPEVFDQIKISTLINLGDFYFYLPDEFDFRISKAESYYAKASEIQDKYNTQNLHLLLRMSQIYLSRNDLSNAEKYLNQIVSTFKKFKYRGYEMYPNALLELAKIFYRKGLDKKAEKFYRESLLYSSKYLNSELSLMANDERLYLENFSKKYDLINFATQSDSAARMSFLSIINRKGLLEEIERKQYQLIKLNTKNKDFLARIRELNSKASLLTINKEERSKTFEEIRTIQKKIYDKELNINNEDYFIQIEEIAKSLSPNSILLEFKRYFPLILETNEYDFDSPRYGVFILNSSGNLDYIDLGSALAIENKLYDTISSINNPEISEDINQNLIKELSRLLIYPLKNNISAYEKIYFSLDSFLNEVPIYALKNLDTGNYIAEEKKIRLISTPKEILRKYGKNSFSNKPLIVANPNFNLRQENIKEKLSEINSFKIKRSKEFLSREWGTLPYTEKEGKSIAKITNGLLITGNKASSEEIQNINSPLILHIASHSYFDSGDDDEHPLIKSGVVLAGANVSTNNSIDDGLLTALEFSKMDLEGTELVVISGCDSGRGFVKNGDNIYGLRRSITVAGAKSSILTLWPVDDSATAAFMRQFYSYLKLGLDRYDAFNQTQKDFRDNLIKSNDGDNWNEIFFWGAFQISGSQGKIRFN